MFLVFNTKKLFLTLFLFICIIFVFTSKSHAATYTYNSGYSSDINGTNAKGDVEATVIGHNTTHGITENLSFTILKSGSDTWQIDYVVPDDGCTWNIYGYIYIRYFDEWTDTNGTYAVPKTISGKVFTATHTTTGSFSGPSPKTATDAANTAATNATNAYNAANSAKISADLAASRTYYNSQSAAYWGYHAYSNANTTASRTWDSTTSKSAATLAKEASDNASTASVNSLTAANNTTYNGQSAAYWAYQASQNTFDITPPTIQDLKGLNGATCTTSGVFKVVVTASDNVNGQLTARASIDGEAYGVWYNIPQETVSVSLTTIGAHLITVEVKDVAGNTSTASMSAFRI